MIDAFLCSFLKSYEFHIMHFIALFWEGFKDFLRCQKECLDIEGAQASSLGCTVSSLVCWSGQDLFFFLIFIWLCWVLVVACGIYNQGWNPGPLHWECRVLAGGPPGKSPGLSHSSWTQQWFRNWSVIFFFFWSNFLLLSWIHLKASFLLS